jgi:hypothetical protein
MARIENDPSARMQVRRMSELAHPAACCVCGNGTCDLGYLDLGVYFDYEGTMYLCMTCAYQAGETVGLYTPEEIKITQQLAESLGAENDALKLELHNVTEQLNAANVLLRDYLAGGTNSNVVSISSEESPAEPVSNSEPVTEAVIGEPTSEEPDPKPRLADSGGPKLRDITFN